MANGIADASPSEPWWARAITRWGLGTVLAIYLIYLLAGRVISALDLLNTNLSAHMQSQDTVKELLGQVCANTAKTEDEKTFCYDIRTRGDLAQAAATAAATIKGGGS